jgi:hypothetical protein
MQTPLYEYEVRGNYGQGWEMVTTEASLADGRDQLRVYRENDPTTPYKLSKVRVVKADKPTKYPAFGSGVGAGK